MTIAEGLAARARENPHAPALLAPDREVLSRDALVAQLRRVRSGLRALGIGRNDRLACVLPQGPDAAGAFLTLASCAAFAPLNPAYREAELDFYLSDLAPAALVVPPGEAAAARAVAGQRGIPVLELFPQAAAGAFRLRGATGRPASADGACAADDVALLLHTSGTTARPKLVPLRQRNLCASARAIGATLGLEREDRCLELMPLFHIHGLIGALLSSALAGGSVVCPPGFFAPRVFAWIEDFTPTWTSAVPTMYQALLARAEAHAALLATRPLRLLRSSSAAMPPTVMAALERVFGAPVIESYGMTEASHQMASNPLPPGVRKPGSVGPSAGPELRVLAADGGEAGVGEVGEVVIRGPGVTNGYVENPAANAAAFTDGWFRTGDEGRLDADGYLFLTGRIKEIINRGGEKISPREIDERLLAHPAVAQAVCFALPDPRLGEDVAAAVVLRAGAEVEAAALRAFCGETLAAFKVPRRIVFLDAIPKGPTGKLRRIGLAAQLGLAAEEVVEEPGRAPEGEAEERVAALWREVLERDEVGAEQDFLAAGGDSMLATLLVARLRAAFGRELDVLALFEAPTVAAQARLLAAAPEQAEAPLTPRTETGPAPLSEAQRRLWIMARLAPEAPLLHRPLLLRLTGRLDAGKLKDALRALLERHRGLLCGFPEEAPGRPVAVEGASFLMLPCEDLRGLPREARHAALHERAVRDGRTPFALGSGPLVRAWLYRLDEAEHALFLVFHHLVFDGWSEGVLVRELAALYAGDPLPELPLQVADVAAWQAGRAGEREQALAWWREQLAGCPSLALPLDHPRPPQPSYRAGRCRLLLPSSLARRLEKLGREAGATLYMVLLAGFGALLGRTAGQRDVVLGTPVSGRTRTETEGLIGCFMNIVALRTRIDEGMSFHALLAAVREATLGALAHQLVPFDRLVQALRPARHAGRWPLFQVLFQLRNHARVLRTDGAVRFEVADFDPGLIGGLDLSLDVETGPSGLLCTFDYAIELFEAGTIEALAERYRRLLEAALEAPARPVQRLPWLPEEERQAVLALGRGPRREMRASLLHRDFERCAAEHAERPALDGLGGVLSYGALDRRACRLAARLQERGAGPGRVVGILSAPDRDFVTGVLATLKTGAAWLPLDARQPAARIASLCERARPCAVLVGPALEALLPAATPRLDFEPGEGPGLAKEDCAAEVDDRAYVMPTSGSTGAAKLVAIPHRAIVEQLDWRRTAVSLPGGRVLLAASISFDDSVWELFVPLSTGGTVVLPPASGVSDLHGLARHVARYDVEHMCLVPSLLRLFLAVLPPEGLPRLRMVTSGGEVFETGLLAQVRAALPDVAILSGYGPTEATIAVSFFDGRTAGDGPAHLGPPRANVRLYILDDEGALLPRGLVGELYIAGPALADGYLGDPEETAARFLPDPFAGEGRMYRTGDFVRWRSDGNLAFHGRRDRQVKLAGVRIELGEIEAALRACPGVRDAAAALLDGPPRLGAWVVGEPVGDLRARLAERLPAAMLPASVERVATLPRTASGKLDRDALRTLEPLPARPRPPLQGETQRQLGALWRELLGIDVGPSDNFYDAGGHSLLAIECAARIESQLGVQLEVRHFATATLAQLASLCEQRQQDAKPGLAGRLFGRLKRALGGE